MRAVIPVVVVLVGLMIVASSMLLITSVGPALGEWAQGAIDRRRERQRARDDAAAPWMHYSRLDPASGEYMIGIERVTRDRVLDCVEMARIPGDDLVGRLEWEGRAIVRAQELARS